MSPPIKDPFERLPPLPFADLMALKRLDVNHKGSSSFESGTPVEVFQSLAPAYSPFQRAYGGHVFAQAAYAASKTVPRGALLHNVTGYFFRFARIHIPFVYSVRKVRDGRVYRFRAVDARQNGEICFSCIASFKLRESHLYSHQPRIDEERYRDFLEGKQPRDHPISPGIDTPWYIKRVEEGTVQELDFPGVEVRKVNMDKYNQTEHTRRNPQEYRQLQFYSLRGSPEGGDIIEKDAQVEANDRIGEYDNLYACAHLYASDRNSLLIIPRALGQADDPEAAVIGSLSCNVIFHEHGEALRMLSRSSILDGEKLQKKWFLQEAWTSRSGDNRAMHESRLWTSDGVLLATTMQDSMIRFKLKRQKL